MKCPECNSKNTVKDGFARYWLARKKVKKQKYLCNDCGRHFREGSKR